VGERWQVPFLSFPFSESLRACSPRDPVRGTLLHISVYLRPGFGKIALMERPLSAEELFPLVDRLSPHERLRLLRLISLRPAADDRDAYLALPPRHDEFSSDTDPLGWDADGWEEIG